MGLPHTFLAALVLLTLASSSAGAEDGALDFF
jgi:hypothetical protein